MFVGNGTNRAGTGVKLKNTSDVYNTDEWTKRDKGRKKNKTSDVSKSLYRWTVVITDGLTGYKFTLSELSGRYVNEILNTSKKLKQIISWNIYL